jgi:hypothetical protein
MKITKLIILLSLVILIGCEEKPMDMEDTIYDYYDYLFGGELEKSQEILEWDNKLASIIDYYSTMSTLNTNRMRIKDIVITSIQEDHGKGMATVNIIYEHSNKNEVIEKNRIHLILKNKDEWKITSIIRE